jgi:phage shock protein PspC (stress-responsive transcriptional regulator)
MQKVISINLNGNAYQLDDTAYEALRAYLDRAEAVLKDNPDQAEIVADLEQALAEKCNKFLGPHKTVVTAAEIEQVIKEMGPVESGTADAGEARSDPAGSAREQSGTDQATKRLYQIREGAMISGVCNGLAAYLGIDVTILRVVFVILAVITKGAWVGVYFLAMFVIPHAHTSEQRAAAHGLPFNAQEVIDSAKKNLEDFKLHSHDWKRQWRRQQRHWRQHMRRHRRRERQQWWDGTAEHSDYSSQVLTGMMAPLLGLYSAGLFVLLIAAIVSLVKAGAVFGWMLPAGMPIWVGMVGLWLAFHALWMPVRFARYGPPAVWNGFLGFGFTLFAFWLAYTNVPEVREFVRNLPEFFRNLNGPPR